MPSTFSKPTTHYGNTFNKDVTLVVRPENAERMLKRLHYLALNMKYGLEKAPFKITVGEQDVNGLVPIRIRAYSTKNWEQAAERLAEFLNRKICPFADVRIECAGDSAYLSTGDFVIKGKQLSDDTFSNTIGYYVVEMNEKDSHFWVSLHLPVKDATSAAEAKFYEVCDQLQKALNELEAETNFNELVCQLDPEVIAIKEQLDRERQQRIEAERRSAELAERRAKLAERAAKEQLKQDEQTLNRFAALKVDELDTTPHSSTKKTTSWASKAGEYLPPPPVAAQQEKPSAKPVALHTKPDAHTAAPASPPRKCNFAENCRRHDCKFEHPASRDVSKLLPKEEYEKMRAEKHKSQPYKGKTACRNGSDCTYHNCKFSHPDDYQEEEKIVVEEEKEDEEKEEDPVTYHISTGDFPPLSEAAASGNSWY